MQIIRLINFFIFINSTFFLEYIFLLKKTQIQHVHFNFRTHFYTPTIVSSLLVSPSGRSLLGLVLFYFLYLCFILTLFISQHIILGRLDWTAKAPSSPRRSNSQTPCFLLWSAMSWPPIGFVLLQYSIRMIGRGG